MLLALAAQLGRKADALREARGGSRSFLRPRRGRWRRPRGHGHVELLVGDHDAAITRLTDLLTIPSDVGAAAPRRPDVGSAANEPALPAVDRRGSVPLEAVSS
jgi:hypothetical protein